MGASCDVMLHPLWGQRVPIGFWFLIRVNESTGTIFFLSVPMHKTRKLWKHLLYYVKNEKSFLIPGNLGEKIMNKKFRIKRDELL